MLAAVNFNQMALRKLDNEEQKIVSQKITELTELNQKAIALEAKAYEYDWQQLDRALKQALLEYRHILNTAECAS